MSLPWYKEGLSFQCTGCGKCCTGSPGYVWVTPLDIEAISKYLHIDIDTFCSRYVKKVGDRYSLTEKNSFHDCSFFENNKCLIYPVRPKQCATFPFWNHNLTSKTAWENIAKECEGISSTAPKVSFHDIEAQRHDP